MAARKTKRIIWFNNCKKGELDARLERVASGIQITWGRWSQGEFTPERDELLTFQQHPVARHWYIGKWNIRLISNYMNKYAGRVAATHSHPA